MLMPARRESLERFREHLVQIDDATYASCDVRIEFLASSYRHKIGHIVDQAFLDVAAFLRCS